MADEPKPEEEQCYSRHWALLASDTQQIKEIKTKLEAQGYYDNSRVITKLSEKEIAIPVLTTFPPVKCLTAAELQLPPYAASCTLKQVELRTSNKPKRLNLLETMKSTLVQAGIAKSLITELMSLLSNSWFKHGDMVVLSVGRLDIWQHIPATVWPTVASKLLCTRIALQEKVSPDCYRTPVAKVVLGDDGWVEHVDNGVKYVFDVTRSMFCQGNITEKLRMAQLDCFGQVIVDLFAGIGYFSLPLLVHSKAKLVHCCEWNHDAIEGLKRGLQANGVGDRCIIHIGDNREVAPRGVADRVILGLIPSSELSWPTACASLRPDSGGWLHIHSNVSSGPTATEEVTGESFSSTKKLPNSVVTDTSSSHQAQCHHTSTADGASCTCNNQSSNVQIGGTGNKGSWTEWAKYVTERIRALLNELHPATQWTVCVEHIERVKSYAPHVDHLVLDVQCRP